MNHPPDIDRIYLYARGLYEAKYCIVKNHQCISLKYFKDPKASIDYLSYIKMSTQILMETVQVRLGNIDRVWWYGCWYH